MTIRDQIRADYIKGYWLCLEARDRLTELLDAVPPAGDCVPEPDAVDLSYAVGHIVAACKRLERITDHC